MESRSSEDVDAWISKLLGGDELSEAEALALCKKMREVLANSENCAPVQLPVTVCGDVHGQYNDLKEIFRLSGKPPHTNYLFLGDYVDRGYASVLTVQMLIAFKVRYPNRVTLTRGNHESRNVSLVYGFYDESLKIYGTHIIWKEFTDVFDYFPVSALIANEVFCMHGGLSPAVDHINEINTINRIGEIPHEGIISDLLWSDPVADSPSTRGWVPSERGSGYFFGPTVTQKFNHSNKLKFIARAHQLVDEGYNWMHEQRIVTIFSAPNYCYRCGNEAALLELSEHGEANFIQFDSAPRDRAFDAKQEFAARNTVPDFFL